MSATELEYCWDTRPGTPDSSATEACGWLAQKGRSLSHPLCHCPSPLREWLSLLKKEGRFPTPLPLPPTAIQLPNCHCCSITANCLLKNYLFYHILVLAQLNCLKLLCCCNCNCLKLFIYYFLHVSPGLTKLQAATATATAQICLSIIFHTAPSTATTTAQHCLLNKLLFITG
jgi:hypothetical protein